MLIFAAGSKSVKGLLESNCISRRAISWDHYWKDSHFKINKEKKVDTNSGSLVDVSVKGDILPSLLWHS